MTRAEFLVELEDLINLPTGTLKGPETLKNLPGWDSLAFVSFLALMDEKLQMSVAVDRLGACQTVNDLVALAGDRLSDARKAA